MTQQAPQWTRVDPADIPKKQAVQPQQSSSAIKVSQEEYDRILMSQPKLPQQPAQSGRAIKVSQEEYDRILRSQPKQSTEEAPIDRTENIGRGLESGLRGMAQSVIGTLPEAAGQAVASAYDALRAPTVFPGMTNEQFTQMKDARAAQVPTQNPMQGWSESTRELTGTRPQDMAAYAQDPRTTPENAPYYRMGGPGGYIPIPQFGTAQQARLGYEVANTLPQVAPAAVAAVATGGMGAIPAIVAGVTGGGLEGLSQYEQAIEKGETPQEALRQMAIMGTGSAALNALPWTRGIKLLPERFQNRVIQGLGTGLLEGATEMGEGGVQQIAETKQLPQTQEEWVDAAERIAKGVWDERSVFLAAAITGLGGGVLADPKNVEARQKAQQEAGQLLLEYKQPKLLGYRGKINADGSVIYEPEFQRAPGDPAPEFGVGPGVAPITTEPSQYRSIEELSQNIPPQQTAETIPRRELTVAEMQAMQQSGRVEPGVGMTPSSPGSIERIVLPSEMPIAPLAQEPINIGPGGATIGPPQSNIGIEPMGEALAPQLPPGAREPELRMPYIPQDVIVPPAGRTVAPEMPVVPSQAQQAAPEPTASREDANRVVDELAAQLGIQPIEESTPQAIAKAKLESRRAARQAKTEPKPVAEFAGWQERPRKPPIALYNIPQGTGMTTVSGETATAQGFDLAEPTQPAPERLPEPEVSPAPDIDEMIAAAAQWRGAAKNADAQLGEDRKSRVRLSRLTTKADLDRYLMDRFGVNDVTARNVSNELTARNIPDDTSASLADFSDQPWHPNNLRSATTPAQVEKATPSTVRVKTRTPSYDLSTEELVQRIKAENPNKSVGETYGIFVKERYLTPEIDAKEFGRIWDSVNGNRHEKVEDVSFVPTHIDSVTGAKVMLTPTEFGHKVLFENGMDGSEPGPVAERYKEIGTAPLPTQAMPAPPKPTPKERKLAKDRVDKHGLTKEQMDYLTGEIQAKWDTLPRGPKDVDPKSDTRAVIKVPGDGTFIIESQLAANAIHKRLTGKWIDEGSAATYQASRLGSEVKWGGFKETPNPQKAVDPRTTPEYTDLFGGTYGASAKTLKERKAAEDEALRLLNEAKTPVDVRYARMIYDRVMGKTSVEPDAGTAPLPAPEPQPTQPQANTQSEVRSFDDIYNNEETPQWFVETEKALEQFRSSRQRLMDDMKFNLKEFKAGRLKYIDMPGNSKAAKIRAMEGVIAGYERDIKESFEAGSQSERRALDERLYSLEVKDMPIPNALVEAFPSSGKGSREQIAESLKRKGYKLDGDTWVSKNQKLEPAPTTTPPAQQPRTTAEVPRKVTINKLLSLVPEDVVRYDSKNNQIAFDNSQEGITRVQEAMDKALDSIPKTPTTQAKYEEAYGEIMDSVFSKQQEGTAQTTVEPSVAPQVETTGERLEALQSNRDNMTPEQYSAERDSIMAEKRESAKAQKKKGESGFISLSVPMNAARSVAKFIKEGRRVEFKHGLRESKPLSVELRGEINRATKEAEQAVADVTNAYRDSISTNALQRSTVNAFKEVPEDVRIQINDYLAEPDRAEKAKRLQALPEPMRAPVRRLREIVDTLSARLADSGVVSQGQAEIIRGNLGHYLHRSFKIFKTPEAWRKEVPEIYKENMRNFLRKEHPTDNEAIINQRLQEWLNVSMDNEGNILFPGKKLGTMNKTSLEQRNAFPKEVLDLWGVERDGILNFLETVKASAEMMANYKFLNNTVKVGRGNYIFTAEDVQAINKGTAPPEVVANFRRLSDAGKLVPVTKDASLHAGDSGKQASKYHQLGPLADAMVDSDFLAALENLNKITEREWFIASLIELNSLWKMGKTIYSPGTTAVNFHSNTGFALSNGWLTYQNPAQTARLMKQALDTAGTEVRPHGHKPEHRALANEMRGLGVIGDTDTSSELQASYERTRKGKVMSGIKKAAESTLPPDVVRALGGAHSFMMNVYQAGDDFWKAFGWLVETQMLKDSGMSEAQAKREAALRVRAVLPTYSEAHKIVQGIRDIPFFGNFPTFVSEVPRNVINTLQQTQMDWRTPGRRTIAIHRTVGTLAAMGFMSLGAEMAKNAAGLDDDDEKTLLNGVADWDRASSIAFQPVDRAKGIYTGVNLSRQSPHAVLVDPVVAAMRADSMTTGGISAAAKLLGPYTDEGGATKMLIDLVRNMDENGRKIVLDSDPIEEKFKKRAVHFMKAFEPGVSRDIRKAVADENPVKTAIERSSGLRKVKVDLPESLKFMAMDYLKAKREPYLDVRRAERAGNPEDYAEQVRQLKEADKQAFDRLHEMVAGMKKMGVKHELIVKALKDAGLTGTQQRNSVMNGNWREPKIQDNLRVDEPD